MKKVKFITPILTTAAIVPVATMIGCSCTPVKLEMSQNSTLFGITGNFKKGTTYEITADLNKWTSGKPEGTDIKDKFVLAIYSEDANQNDFINKDKIKVTVDGSSASIEITTGYQTWPNAYIIKITSTVKQTSKVILKGAKAKADFGGAFICYKIAD